MTPIFTVEWPFVKTPVDPDLDFLPRPMTAEAKLVTSLTQWLLSRTSGSTAAYPGTYYDIKTEYFVEPEAKFFWEVLMKLYDENLSLEASSFLDICGVHFFNTFKEEADPNALGNIVLQLFDPRFSVNTRNVEYQVEMFLKEYYRRAIGDTLKSRQPDAFLKGQMLTLELDRLQEIDKKKTSTHHNLNGMMEDLSNEIEERMLNPDRNSNVKWGYDKLDADIPIARGHLVIIGGRSGSGKTTFALNILKKMVLEDKKIAMFTLEMSKLEIIQTLVSQVAKVSYRSMDKGDVLVSEDFDRMHSGMMLLNNKSLTVVDKPGIGVDDIKRQALMIRRRMGSLDAIFIDHVHIMGSGGKKHNSIREQIMYISSELKNMAKELDVPIFALAQMNRSAEIRTDKTPQVSDLKESGSLEQDADSIVFTYRNTDVSAEDESYVICRKNRHGDRTDFKIHMEVNPVFRTFEER